MTLCKTQLPVTYLKPGETCYTDEPSLVMTSLRSSIAIIMFNKRLHFAGICHVRPAICKNSEFCTGHCDEAFIHMDCASKQMLEIFEFLGIKRDEIAVRVFGGADVTVCPDIDIFKTILLNEGLHVADSHVGETFMRKILFFTDTGEVFAKQIRGNDLPQEE
jgi:chemotaxis protein CheD